MCPRLRRKSRRGQAGLPEETAHKPAVNSPAVSLAQARSRRPHSGSLANFEEETGIHVTEINFEDEEEMPGAVQPDLSAFDLVVASDDTAREMREAKMLAPLDLAKIPNLKYIDKKYLNMPCDPEQKYSVPYMTGTTGMIVNTRYIQEETDSWKVLFDPRYKGKPAMLNNQWEVVGAACKLLGYALNTTAAEELEYIIPK